MRLLKLNKTLLILVITLSILLTNNMVVLADRDDEWVYTPQEIKCEMPTKDNTTSDGLSIADDAFTPGTEQYSVAKKVFDVLTQKYGFSGAAAAGVLGNIKQESNMIPDLAEGGARFGMNGTEDKTISIGAYSPGGGGLFQETPYTQYVNSPEWQSVEPEGWGIENQIAHAWNFRFKNKDAEWRMAQNMSKYGLQTYFTKIEQFLSTNDPVAAAESFMVGYLIPAAQYANLPNRVESAKRYEQLFNKDQIQADPSKWIFTSSNNNILDVNSLTESTKKLNKKCGFKKSQIGEGLIGIAWSIAVEPDSKSHYTNGKIKGANTKQELVDVLNQVYEKIKVDPGGMITASCDRTVVTPIIASGTDTEIPWGAVKHIYDYMKSRPDKWAEIPNATTAEMQPGDVIIFDYNNEPLTHMTLYLGDVEKDGNLWMIEGSYGQYEPIKRKFEPNSQIVSELYKRSDVAKLYLFRFVGTPTGGGINSTNSITNTVTN